MAATDRLEWTGAALDGAWTNTNNWTVYSGTPGAGIPSAGEGAVFGRKAQFPVYVSPTAAVALNNLSFTPDCRVNFGATTGNVAATITNLTVDSGTAPTLRYAGRGALFYMSGNVTSLHVDEAVGQVNHLGGTITNARTFSGNVYLGSSVTVTSVYNQGANVTVERNGTNVVTNAINAAGTLTLRKNVTTLDVGGDQSGSLQSVVVLEDQCAVTTANQNGGAVMDRSVGDIGTLNGYRGAWMTKGNPGAARTITTYNGYNKHYLQKRWPGGQFTISTDNSYGADDLAALGNGGDLPTV